ncbi:MAG: hypothetical protein ABEJ27_02890 [Halodesulfurarchaeum sp.]
MPGESSDPRDIRSIAVTAEDVVSAYEAGVQRDANVVLRVTPPFHGRMRARLHRKDVDASEVDAEPDPAPIEIPPADLLDDPPTYPHPDETEDALRQDPDETYSVERHHDLHAERVDQWRREARNAIVDTVSLETEYGSHDVEVKLLESVNG